MELKKLRRRGGFSMPELIVAVALSSGALLALVAVFMPIVRTQMQAIGDLRTQGNALAAHKGLLKSLRDATEIYLPGENSSANVLSGCSNWDTSLGGPLTGTQGRSFYYCVSGGKLYYHTATPSSAPCQMATPTCTAGLMVAENVSLAPGQSFYFARPANRRGVIEVRYQVSYSTGSKTPSYSYVDEAISFQSTSEAATTGTGSTSAQSFQSPPSL